jgi:hypothetical protein
MCLRQVMFDPHMRSAVAKVVFDGSEDMLTRTLVRGPTAAARMDAARLVLLCIVLYRTLLSSEARVLVTADWIFNFRAHVFSIRIEIASSRHHPCSSAHLHRDARTCRALGRRGSRGAVQALEGAFAAEQVYMRIEIYALAGRRGFRQLASTSRISTLSLECTPRERGSAPSENT